MKRSRILLVLTVVTLFVAMAVLGGCSSTPAASSAPASESAAASSAAPASESAAKTYKVGFIVADLENPAWNAIATGLKDAAEAAGFTCNLVSASGNAATQLKNAQDFIAQQYDAVALAATDSSSANATVKALNEANIPVFIDAIKPDDDTVQYVTMIDAQNEQGTYDAGMYLAETYKNKGMTGVAAEITISLARSNGQKRDAGFKKAMEEAGIEVVQTKEAIKYTRDESYKFTQDLITSTPNLNILYCNYDEAALGAMKAIQDAGKQDEILLGDFDGTPESLKAVMDGKMSVIAIQALWQQGNILGNAMVDYLANGVTPEALIMQDCPLVTTENAATEAPKFLPLAFGPDATFPE